MTKEELKEYELELSIFLKNVENRLKCEFLRFDNIQKEYVFIFGERLEKEEIRLSKKALEYIGNI